MPGTIWSTLHVSVRFIRITTPETSTVMYRYYSSFTSETTEAQIG